MQTTFKMIDTIFFPSYRFVGLSMILDGELIQFFSR